MTSPTLNVSAIVVAVILIGGGAALLFFVAPNSGNDNPVPHPLPPSTNPPHSPSAGNPAPANSSPPVPEDPEPPQPVAPAPAEKAIAGNVTPEVISKLRSSEEVARAHRILTRQLLTRLEELHDTRDRERIRIAVQELAERFYLLKRVTDVHQLEAPGPASLEASDGPRLQNLRRVWQENLDLSLTVDLAFRQRGLLQEEHVLQMLERWLQLAEQQPAPK